MIWPQPHEVAAGSGQPGEEHRRQEQEAAQSPQRELGVLSSSAYKKSLCGDQEFPLRSWGCFQIQPNGTQ
jgi:hypothetical protein